MKRKAQEIHSCPDRKTLLLSAYYFTNYKLSPKGQTRGVLPDAGHKIVSLTKKMPSPLNSLSRNHLAVTDSLFIKGIHNNWASSRFYAGSRNTLAARPDPVTPKVKTSSLTSSS